ncbi:sugar kinase [Qipengyuania vesicularis]|uniref:sugar kinase n=1 Tax=Qipengyuania vesicularis TaxID=2867232 RepID=UPI001C88CCC6|nr:sugar kinase [Qipengyuania vesicularis]MBX7527712.1 sugar kinase [Qipengyuania vesicularis]
MPSLDEINFERALAMTTFIFGEAMLEYHTHGGEGLRYGGDTLNTAIHLARAGHEVSYVTAVGTDPISDALVEAWKGEGVDTRHVLRHPHLNPGIYAIHLDEHGERSFLYWRDRSAAREMFELPGMEMALTDAADARLVYFSHISLAIVDESGRSSLFDLARKRKAAGRAVAYDSNFRPALWSDLEEARTVSRQAMEAATIGLPTNSDERELWGFEDGEIEIAKRWLSAGQEAVAVKAAEKGCVVGTSQTKVPYLLDAMPTNVVDSSGAGDGFNAGFLGGWLEDRSLDACVEDGQALARATLGHQGAIKL